MSTLTIGLLLFVAMLLLMAIRVPIAVAMFVPGAVGYVILSGWDPLLAHLRGAVYGRVSVYDLSVIPLFMLMGGFAVHGGLSKALFDFANALLGRFKGGMAMAGILACAAFGAISGSTVATTATIAQVAYPEMRRINYSGRLATATVAAGGTLGILIPPSVPLIIYAVLTQESIAQLFVAAVIPGILAVIGYMVVLRIMVAREGGHDQEQAKASTAERIKAFVNVLPVIGVFTVVIVGIYGGWSNPTEAASIGAAACGILAVIQGGMRWDGIRTSLLGTAETTAMIFLVLLGADLLNSGLALTQMPNELAEWVKNSGLAPMLVLAAILVLYLLLGCVMDSLAMILLTIPIFYPVIMGLDFFGLDPSEKSIWFGILALMVVEIGLVTPPLGMNLFIVQRAAGNVPLAETARGVIPFITSDLLRIVLLALFPGISLWLLSF